MKTIGGFSSIKYSLNVAKEVGVLPLYKTLSSKNTCKTCALGMGGQKGGMHNEAGDFPEVCKKSIQAQLTDIQPEIPPSLFQQKSIEELKKIPPFLLERLGRLNHPLYKKKGDTHFSTISWEDAMQKIISGIKGTKPERSFFYSSGRSSNETAFLLQLFVRMYGTNNINNCSYFCHQASGVGMASTLGTGTATIGLDDLHHADMIFVIGANPASNHPRYLKELIKCNRRGGEVIVINPLKEPGLERFAIPSDTRSMLTAGGSKVATQYIQPNIGGDIALLKGIAKYVIESGAVDDHFTTSFTNNFEEFKQDILNTSWENITTNSGINKEEIIRIAQLYCQAKNVIFSWAMGITHHDHGVDNVEAIVNLALLRGMAGRKGAGLLPLRGHSNVQGIGSMGVAPELKEKVFKNIESKLGIQLPATPGMDTLACINASLAGAIDTALFVGGNLYASSPDSPFAEKALGAIPFKVFMTTTLNQGHLFGTEGEVIILPVAARDEEKQSTTQESMFNFVRLSDGGIVRLNNVKSETDIICDIALGVLGEEKIKFSEFKKHNNIRKAIAAVIPGFDSLENIGETKEEFEIKGRVLKNPEFPTPNKKANFRVVAIPKLKGEKNEFRLMTNRSEGQFNSIIYEEKDLFRGQTERWIVLMNKEDIARLGLKENDKVTIENSTGKMVGVKVKAYDISRGSLMAYYPEANVLIPATADKRSKTPSFKSVAVKIIK